MKFSDFALFFAIGLAAMAFGFFDKPEGKVNGMVDARPEQAWFSDIPSKKIPAQVPGGLLDR